MTENAQICGLHTLACFKVINAIKIFYFLFPKWEREKRKRVKREKGGERERKNILKPSRNINLNVWTSHSILCVSEKEKLSKVLNYT